VIAVRAAQFSTSPPVARVVIDLSSAQDHAETYVGNQLVIHIGSKPAGGSAPSAAEAKPAKSAGAFKPEKVHATSAPPHAFALLGKARDLTVSDLEPLEAKAQAGDPESETILALAYHEGTLLRVDDTEAVRLLQHAAARGFVPAEESMGIFAEMGFGMAPDKTKAVSWYTKAAEHGSTDAATNLGLMYSTADGVAKDDAKAVMWFRRAAEAGDPTAQLNLAVLYHRGQGVAKDDAQSEAWLSKAANQDLLPAMLELATWEMQHGSKLEDAIRWYKRAAALDDALAEAALGDIYSDPKLGKLDYAQAVEWYRKAAEQGQRNGQFGLATRYLEGQGVPRDLSEARRWLAPAADQGHPYAQLLLAKMLKDGVGGPPDGTAAEKYFEMSADYGLSEAQYRLGMILAADHSNEQNLIEAYKWLLLAQSEMEESAAAAQELKKSLTAAQLAQAERDADIWRLAHQPQH
ncbi:MAG TPA: tetratricopeptide repeat protein, partial [Terriglobales bacterium]|nr:tetratricopeptide repeat protein [Terriglobales bacterium]